MKKPSYRRAWFYAHAFAALVIVGGAAYAIVEDNHLGAILFTGALIGVFVCAAATAPE